MFANAPEDNKKQKVEQPPSPAEASFVPSGRRSPHERASTTVEANATALLNLMTTPLVDELVMGLIGAAKEHAAGVSTRQTTPPPMHQQYVPPVPMDQGMGGGG